MYSHVLNLVIYIYNISSKLYDVIYVRPWWPWWPWELKVFLFPRPACDFSLHQEVDGSVSAVYAGDALHGFTAQRQRSAEIRSVGPQASHRDAPRHRNCEVCHRHHMSTHVTCHMSHVNTLDASQQLQRKTPNLQGNNMEQHEQLNLTKLLPKLLTTVKGTLPRAPNRTSWHSTNAVGRQN